MKTQIIRRIILAVICLIICANNNTNNAQLNNRDASCKNKELKTVVTKDFSNSTCVCCVYCTDEHATPAIPEPNGDHEFHYFHPKHKHPKNNFFKTAFNKIIEVIYYFVVLITYVSFKH